MNAAAADRAALHAALQDTLAMARQMQANLGTRERAARLPDWRGRAALWGLQARAEHLRAQLQAPARQCGASLYEGAHA